MKDYNEVAREVLRRGEEERKRAQQRKQKDYRPNGLSAALS